MSRARRTGLKPGSSAQVCLLMWDQAVKLKNTDVFREFMVTFTVGTTLP